MSVNKVIIVGRLGQDPELKYTPSGAAVCNFSVATSENWSDRDGQRQERTEWHRIVVWGKQAENCNQYLAKGRQVYLEGSLQTRSWEAKEGGKRYTTEIIARTVQFLGGNSQGSGSYDDMDRGESSYGAPGMQASSNNDYQIQSDAGFTADDIPF